MQNQLFIKKKNNKLINQIQNPKTSSNLSCGRGTFNCAKRHAACIIKKKKAKQNKSETDG